MGEHLVFEKLKEKFSQNDNLIIFDIHYDYRFHEVNSNY